MAKESHEQDHPCDLRRHRRLRPDKFVAHFADNVVFRFGKGKPVVGRAALREAATSFFTTIRGLAHRLLQSRDTAETSMAKIDVEYVRTDGKHLTAPNADTLVFDSDLVSNWQIYA